MTENPLDVLEEFKSVNFIDKKGNECTSKLTGSSLCIRMDLCDSLTFIHSREMEWQFQMQSSIQ